MNTRRCVGVNPSHLLFLLTVLRPPKRDTERKKAGVKRMKLKDGFVLREVAGQTVVVATGAASKDFRGMIRLNETGRIIWQGVANGQTADQIADDLIKTFSVDREQALKDVTAMIEQMEKAGFLCP